MLNSSQYKDIIIGQGIRTLPGWKLGVYLYLVDGLLIDFLLGIQAKVHDLRQQGLDNHAIDKRLYPQKLPVTVFTRGEWSSYHMVNTI